jgi:hypothetical protein
MTPAALVPFLVFAGGDAVTRSRAPVETSGGAVLECALCPGEFESLSAVVYANTGLEGLRVSASPLRGPTGLLDPSCVDARLVKWWWQGAIADMGGNHAVEYNPKRVLTAELLLRDDALVRVDERRNRLRSAGTYLPCSGQTSVRLKGARPMDAATLQPVDLPAGTSREFVLTVRVPTGTRAGAYEAVVTFLCAQGTSTLPLRVAVRPFDLEPSRLTYSLYYRGRLSDDGKPTVASDTKSARQYRCEIADMRDHGVLCPANYQGLGDLRRALRIRRTEGLPSGGFYTLAAGHSPKEVRRWMHLCREFGYDEVYFYGADEAEGEALLAQRADWQGVQRAGGRTFVATYKRSRAYETMGSLLNLAVVSGMPDAETAKAWHCVGSQCFAYLCPQVGVERPEVYRRNFGLVLWKAGYDGAMDYAYQHAFHHVWNDFDDRDYRDHVFAYPTINGVVGTLQWEGFREAVDDVRYVTTLEKAMAEAPDQGLAQQAQAWLDSVDPETCDLAATRERAAGWIERLKEGV